MCGQEIQELEIYNIQNNEINNYRLLRAHCIPGTEILSLYKLFQYVVE